MESNLENKIQKIELLRSQISSLPPLSQEVEKALWDKFRLEWNYNSNHIEGNTISYVEAKQFLFKNITANLHTMREWEEMTGHNLAVETIKEWASNTEQPLNESDIRSLHTMILVKNYWSDAVTPDGAKTRREIVVGDYKSFPNSVITNKGELFHYTDPMNVAAEMKELMEWYRTSTNDHPVIKATDFHYKFIRIHPFDDGNGRLARLLLNYELLVNGFPPVIIKSIDKKKYLNCLQAADSGNFEPFYEFIADCLLWSLELVLKAHNGESLEEPDDLEKEISLFKKKIKAKSVQPFTQFSLEDKKKVILQQLNELYIPLIGRIEEKVRDSFTEMFDSFSHNSVLTYNGKAFPFDNPMKYIKLLDENLNQNEFSVHEFILYFYNHFITPKFKSKVEQISFTVEIRCNYVSFDMIFWINGEGKVIKNWHITETIDTKEQDEIVKSVLKMVLSEIDKSIL
ncbi:MAG: Fic family protein [Candidatus Kapabacteria bacterium]|nr:Fic family protein [Candidatus Kapabacteria bacterium]